ncbi:bacteriohemerythrin [Sulfurimicrobium lacus]|uniref:Bacteriohemerythrin n=1 Tax=Sulfurimicrobium lacus TaxID=2715678 RepID=A0A6F8VED6_9PROT|nr:hemerythrin family protein [Sulfurimicrobium lacus]BCB28044.1 bacteriohemerythrin [Sulfurimicrobium lacus]
MQKFHLAWDESRHTLGIASIDRQHHALIDMVNALVDAVERNCDPEQIRSQMAKLIRFTEEHFTHEEEIMLRHGFPEREKHALEHQEVLHKAVTMMEDFKPDDANRVVLVTAFLIDCAENHILHDDRELTLFLQEKGLR